MAHLFSIVAWLCLLLPAPGSPSSIFGTRTANETLTVDLGYEVYQGYHNSTVKQNVWQGIRYAAPPTGENRFRAPKAPLANRNATIPATSLPQRCPQGPQAPLPANYNYTGSEDCLFLSVYAPTDAQDLPVFVWIHGGGYGGGQGNQDVGNITMINHNSFVSVVIQYRLGAFGFLSSDEVERFGDVNNGIRDQLFALQWVQSHIRQFSGDPRKVTIAGESAGAGSVMLLSMAYGGTLGTSLFQNVIAASPYLPMQYGYADWQPSQGYYSFAAAVGCFPGRAYGNYSSTIIDCLRLAPSNVLQNASAVVGASGTWGTWAFLPVTDKDFIRSRPTSQLTAGKVNGARVLSGNNALEGAAFVNPYNISTDADFEAWVQLSYPLLSSSDLDKVFNTYYPASNDSSTTPYATSGTHGETFVNVDSVATGAFARAIALYSETTFVCPSYWLADAFQAHGKEAYKYQFSVPAAQHGADLSAEGLRTQASNIGDAFYEAFTTIWGNFITKSSPSISNALANGNGSLAANAASAWPSWSSYGKNAYQMLNLNQTGGTEVSAHVIAYPVQNATQSIGPGFLNNFKVVDAYSWEGGRGKRCDFWRSVSSRVPE